MITKIVDAQFDGSQFKTILQDSFGNQAVVQTILSSPGVKHSDDVAAMLAQMTTNENNIVANLQAEGLSDQQIEALKKK